MASLSSSASKSDRPAWPRIWPGGEARHPRVGRRSSAIMPTASRRWICSSYRRSHFACSMACLVDDRFYGLATAHPTAEWIANQITQTCGWKQAPRYLIRDRDGACGEVFIRRVRSMGIRDRPTSPRSPWQNACAERLIGSIRRECLDMLLYSASGIFVTCCCLTSTTIMRRARTYRCTKCAPIAHGSEGRAYSSPSNPGRAASPKYSDLICDRHRQSSVKKTIPATCLSLTFAAEAALRRSAGYRGTSYACRARCRLRD